MTLRLTLALTEVAELGVLVQPRRGPWVRRARAAVRLLHARREHGRCAPRLAQGAGHGFVKRIGLASTECGGAAPREETVPARAARDAAAFAYPRPKIPHEQLDTHFTDGECATTCAVPRPLLAPRIPRAPRGWCA